MSFDVSKILFSDTLIPDIFIKEYLPVLDGDSARIYIYCAFLSKKSPVDPDVLANILSIPENILNECLIKLENFGLIYQKSKKITLTDLKERELNKFYRPRTSLDNETLAAKRTPSLRLNTVRHINDTFFTGQMSPSWYKKIEYWYEKFGFDDAVMVMLFNHCSQALAKKNSTVPRGQNYIETVAGQWAEKGIKTPEQLDVYLNECEKYNVFENTISKKANIRSIDEYQKLIVKKWYFEYKYTFEIVEEALQRASLRYKNPSMGTYDYFLTEWHNAGLRSKANIICYEDQKKKKNTENASSSVRTTPQSSMRGYENQRPYDEKYFENLEKKKGSNN